MSRDIAKILQNKKEKEKCQKEIEIILKDNGCELVIVPNIVINGQSPQISIITK